MAKRKFPITRKEFSQIIRKRGAITFGTYGSETCPLAQAIKYKDRQKYKNAMVGVGSWSETGNFLTDSEPLPGWASRFVRAYDRSEGTSADAKRIQPRIV